MAKKSKIQQALELSGAELPIKNAGHSRIHNRAISKAGRYAKMADKQENKMASLLDTLSAIKKAVPKLSAYLEGKVPADVAFSSIAPASLFKLVEIMGSGESEKNQLDAAKHLLALAGHTPTQKHEIGRMDASTPKEALVSLIMGNKKALSESGIEVEDDDQNKA